MWDGPAKESLVDWRLDSSTRSVDALSRHTFITQIPYCTRRGFQRCTLTSSTSTRASFPCRAVPCPTIPTARLCRPMPDSTNNNASIMSFVISVGACAFDAQDFLQDMMNPRTSHDPTSILVTYFSLLLVPHLY